MRLRALSLIGLVACGGGPPYRLAVRDAYEVGEDATIALDVRNASDDKAVVVITRPDGSTVRERVSLDREKIQVKFGDPQVQPDSVPTFTETGDYRVELRTGNTVLAQHEIRVAVDRLTKKFDDEGVAGFRPIVRYTQARQHGPKKWKLYGALYEHTERPDSRIQVVIHEPGDALDEAWAPYKEEGTLGVMEGNHVRFRERTRSVSASWISGKRIIAMRADELADFERGFIGYFLAKYPSKLDAL